MAKEATLIIRLKDYASEKLSKFGAATQRLGKDLEKSRWIWTGIAAGITAIGTAAVIASGKMEQWQVAFTTMLGSADRADALLKKIRDFAAKTPFDLPQVVEGSKRLLAFGVSANDVIPTLKMLGDVSAGLGVPMERLILNFGQVKAQTKLTGRELRDFAIAGVPLLETLANQLNKTEAEILDMVSAGKIGFPQVEAAFRSMTSEGGRFADLMTRQSQTLFGQFSNLKDAIFNLAESFGRILLPAAKSIVEMLSKAVTWMLNLSPATKLAIAIVAGLTAGFAGLLAVVGTLVASWGAIAAAFAVLVSPITLITVGILGIIAAIGAVTMNFMGFRDILFELFAEILESVNTFAMAFYQMITGNFKAAFNLASQGFKKMKDAGKKSFEDIVANGKAKFKELLEEMKLHNKDVEKEEGINYKAIMDRLNKHYDDQTAARIANEKLEIEYNKRRMQNFESTLNFISSLSTAKNKQLAAIGKAAAISMATIDTYAAANKALASAPPPWNFALAAAVVTAGVANVARISGVALAEGGIVTPRPGGTLATIGEAGRSEAVIPLDDDRAGDAIAGLGGVHVHIHAGTVVADKTSVREFAEMIDEELFHLGQNRLSVSK